MILRTASGKSLILLLIGFFSYNIYSQEPTSNKINIPYIGQPGKDVVWVPTHPELVDKMLEIAGVTDSDYLIDLGSGDGRVVIAAAKAGAKAFGIEYNSELVELSRHKAEEAGVSQRAKFIQADLFSYDLSSATVITMFLLPEINLKLRSTLLRLKPGTRIVSNTFTMGEWEPDNEVTIQNDWSSNWYTALLWIVPANIDGRWSTGSGILDIHQEFQKIYGTITVKYRTFRITGGLISGDNISFTANGSAYTGKISGSIILGTVVCGTSKMSWKALKYKDHFFE